VRRVWLISLALAAALQSLPAQAQSESRIGSNIPAPAAADYPDEPGLSQIDRARIVSNNFGRCVVARYRKKADALVARRLFGKDLLASLKRVTTSECLNNVELTIPTELMLGSVFRALYVRDFGQQPPAIQPQPVDFRVFIAAPDAPEVQNHLALASFAGCVVRSDLVNSRNYLFSTPGSKNETAALNALAPQFNQCLPKGAQIKFSKSVMSAILAEALYREAQPATVPSGGAK
jgi:hypothetical protein